MPTTTRGNITTPAGSEPNDFSLAMAELAQDTMDAVYLEGLVAARPAASTANKGLLYRATDTNTSGGQFISDGTQWVRLTASPWVVWTPTVSLDNGFGSTPSGMAKSLTSTTYIYRILPDSLVEIQIEAVIALSGPYSYAGLVFTSPVASAVKSDLSASVADDVAFSYVGDHSPYGNSIAVYPGTGFNAAAWQFNTSGIYVGRWVSPIVNMPLRVNGTYRV